jgi:hypothetical protein
MASTTYLSDVSTIRGIDVTSEASTTVVGADSGMVFANKYGGAHTYTLPSLAAGTGKVFWFINAHASGTLVITAPSDCFVVTDNTYTTVTQSDSILGGWIMVLCDGTYYYGLQDIGSTFTGS